MFLVFSSLHWLIWIYLVAGPFLTMLNLLLYVFVRDIQPDSLRTGKHSYLGTSLSPRPRFLESRLDYPPISIKSTINFLIPRITNRGLKRSS